MRQHMFIDDRKLMICQASPNSNGNVNLSTLNQTQIFKNVCSEHSTTLLYILWPDFSVEIMYYRSEKVFKFY